MAKVSRRREEYQQLFTENDMLLVEFDHSGKSVARSLSNISPALTMSGIQ